MSFEAATRITCDGCRRYRDHIDGSFEDAGFRLVCAHCWDTIRAAAAGYDQDIETLRAASKRLRCRVVLGPPARRA